MCDALDTVSGTVLVMQTICNIINVLAIVEICKQFRHWSNRAGNTRRPEGMIRPFCRYS
jgi:hypothetical protein